MKKIVSLLLVIVMIFSASSNAFAAGTNYHEENEQVVVTEDGIYIGGNFYTKIQFIQLLETAQEIEINQGCQPFSAIAGGLIAGTWFIPGIGEIVVTAAGSILLAGVLIEAGTWIYDAVVNWFADRAEQKEYDDAKEQGEPTDDHSTQSTSQGSSLPKTGRPRSSKDLVDKDGVKQRRYYDKDGNADEDIDYRHSGVGHEFPHRHIWTDGKRGPGIPF